MGLCPSTLVAFPSFRSASAIRPLEDPRASDRWLRRRDVGVATEVYDHVDSEGNTIAGGLAWESMCSGKGLVVLCDEVLLEVVGHRHVCRHF